MLNDDPGVAGVSAAGGEAPSRLFITPRARKMAREQKLNLTHLRGSGPRGRIVAADVTPMPDGPRQDESVRISALRTVLSRAAIDAALDAFTRAALDIDFEDVLIRATSAALSEMQIKEGRLVSIYFETEGRHVRFDGAAAMPLSAIHRARVEEPSLRFPSSGATMSIRMMEERAVSPVLVSPLPGIDMRLLVQDTTGDAPEISATLSFDEKRMPVELATSMLRSLKQRLERPIFLLL